MYFKNLEHIDMTADNKAHTHTINNIDVTKDNKKERQRLNYISTQQLDSAVLSWNLQNALRKQYW